MGNLFFAGVGDTLVRDTPLPCPGVSARML